MLTRTIDAVFVQKNGWASVKFGDGTEALAAPDADFPLPLEEGTEGVAVTDEKETGGRVWTHLTGWHSADIADIPAVKSQAPAQEKPAKAAVRPAVRFEPRDLSIMAQVALKAAVEARNATGQMNPKGFETNAATVKRAKDYLRGMLEAVNEEWQRQ